MTTVDILYVGGPTAVIETGGVRAAEILGAQHVVPLHFEHWGHFTEDDEALTKEFAKAGLTDRLHVLQPGQSMTATA